MAYPYSAKTRVVISEILEFELTNSNTTASAGVQTSTVDLPPGVYSIGVNVFTTGAGAAATGEVKVYAYQTPDQGNTAVVLSAPMYMLPHAATATATVLTAPASATSAGTSGQLVASISAGLNDTVILPYGMMIATTSNTSTGSISYKIVAQRRV